MSFCLAKTWLSSWDCWWPSVREAKRRLEDFAMLLWDRRKIILKIYHCAPSLCCLPCNHIRESSYLDLPIMACKPLLQGIFGISWLNLHNQDFNPSQFWSFSWHWDEMILIITISSAKNNLQTGCAEIAHELTFESIFHEQILDRSRRFLTEAINWMLKKWRSLLQRGWLPSQSLHSLRTLLEFAQFKIKWVGTLFLLVKPWFDNSPKWQRVCAKSL